jgi:hypothetical protein
MADLVDFNGPEKLIIVDYGISSLNFAEDIYSSWKRWVNDGYDGYLQAIRVIGGDPTVNGQYLGSTFFLMNGWKIRPYEGNHELTISGNFYSEDGYSPFENTIGNYNVLITRVVSNIIDESSGTGLTTEQANQLQNTYRNTNLIKALTL